MYTCVHIVLACDSSTPCPQGQMCQAGQCYITCAADDEKCENGLICTYGGVCGYSCQSSDECPQTSECLSGICETTVSTI